MLVLLAPMRQAQTNVKVINSLNYAQFLNSATSVLRVIPKPGLAMPNTAILRTKGASRRRLTVSQRVVKSGAPQASTATLRVAQKVSSQINQFSSGN